MVVYELPKLLFKFWMIFDNKYLWGIKRPPACRMAKPVDKRGDSRLGEKKGTRGRSCLYSWLQVNFACDASRGELRKEAITCPRMTFGICQREQFAVPENFKTQRRRERRGSIF